MYRQEREFLDPDRPTAAPAPAGGTPRPTGAGRGEPESRPAAGGPLVPVGRADWVCAPYRRARKEATVLWRPPSAVAVAATVSRRVALRGFTTRLALLESLTCVLV